jgi:hypothetical protein
VILPSLTVHEVSNTSIELIPRIVLEASSSACWAASLHDDDETPTRSIVLMTATLTPLTRTGPSQPCNEPDCNERGRAAAGAWSPDVISHMLCFRAESRPRNLHAQPATTKGTR